jgi:pyruvate dehydrogenase E1 component alpha subunit
MGELTKKDLLELYILMQKTRIFEKISEDWYIKSMLKEPNHSCLGQEAITVGACYTLRDGDLVMPSLRSRGAFFARGVDFRTVLMIQAVKQGNHTSGHETSHHSAYPKLGILAGTGMVGSSMALAAGAALGIKIKKQDNVVLNFFGDGACNRGDFHESLNMCAVWNLPCIFIIENNGIALSAENKDYYPPNLDLAQRASGYGIPGYSIDGNDVMAVYDCVDQAVSRARAGKGPTLINCLTMRMDRHVSMASSIDYRAPELLASWADKDPVDRLAAHLIKNDYADQQQLDAIAADIERSINDAYNEIKDLPQVDESIMLQNVYCAENETI